MKCWTLPDACLEVLPSPNATTVYSDRPTRGTHRLHQRPPLRIHVGGLSRDGLSSLLSPRAIGGVRDPLNSEYLRHLERNVRHAGDALHGGTTRSSLRRAALLRTRAAARSNLTMIWPVWEVGFGDVIANTLLPLGELRRLGVMPPQLAVSGLRHEALILPLRAVTTLCASERENLPLLPRCASACYRAIHVCAPVYTDTRNAWAATQALDQAAGLASDQTQGAAEAVRSEGADAHAGRGSAGAVLHVIFAARSGRRLVTNVHALAAECDGSVAVPPGSGGVGVRLRCDVLPANATPTEKAYRIGRADVFVCVWGGDTLNGLHLRRGGAIIEMRHPGFVRGAPWSWVDMHRRWAMRYSNGPASARPLSFYGLSVPHNASVVRAADRACLATAERKRVLNQGKVNKFWQCYWNMDVEVPYAIVHAAFDRFVGDRARGVVHAAPTDDVCRRRKHGGVLVDGVLACPA